MRFKTIQLAPVFVLVVWGSLIYANTLHAPFYFDDEPNITKNPHIRMTRLDPEQILRITNSPNPLRPLAHLTFALNYYIHRYQVTGYHLVNIIIHIVNAFLVFLVVRQTLLLRAIKPGMIPLFAAMLWMTHPVHIQSVTYIVQRMTSMAAMFYMLSLFCYIAARRRQREQARRPEKKVCLLFAACALSGVLALGSKEIAATLPVFLFLYEWYFFQDLDGRWIKKQLPWLIVIAGLIPVLAFFYLGKTPVESILAGYGNRPFTLEERLLTQPRIVAYYISLLFFPHPGRLTLDYDFALSHSLIDPVTTILSVLALCGLFLAALFAAKRYRLVSFAIFWFLSNLAIESSFIPLELIFEHRTYLPSMLPAMIPPLLVVEHVNARWAGIGAMAAVIAVFSMWTYQRNNTWRDEVVFWMDGVKKAPGKARVHVELGQALARRGETETAVACYRRALAIDPENELAHNNLGYMFAVKERPADAIYHYRQAIRYKEDYATPYNNIGVLMYNSGRVEEAITFYRKAIQLEPHYCEPKSNLASALVTRGQAREAVPLFQSVIDLCPEESTAYAGLYGALRLLNEKTAARQAYERLKAVDKDLAAEIKTAVDRMLPGRETGPNTINP